METGDFSPVSFFWVMARLDWVWSPGFNRRNTGTVSAMRIPDSYSALNVAG